MIIEYFKELSKRVARKVLKDELENYKATSVHLSNMIGQVTSEKINLEKKFGGAYALIMFANMFPEIFERGENQFNFKCSPPLEDAIEFPSIEPIKIIEYNINTHEGMYVEEAVKLMLERGLSKEQILTSLYTFGYHFERNDIWWDFWKERTTNAKH